MTEADRDIVDGGAESPPVEPKVDVDTLTRSAGRGALWQLLGGGWQTIVQLGASTVLARRLDKVDFGIMGMAVLVRGLVMRFGALETGGALIAKKDVTQDDLSTAFWMRGGVLVVLFLVIQAGAPLAAMFFRTPQLTWVLRAVALTFLLTAAGSVSRVLLRKNLQFGVMKIIQGGGFALQYAVTIVLVVVFGFAYWALVLGILVSSLAMTVTTIVCARWRPSFRFSRESFRNIFPFAIHGLGTTLTSYIHANIDFLLVGRILGAASMGLYEFAYRIPHMVLNRVSAPVGTVLFPTLAKAQQTHERLAAGYTKIARYVAIIVFPMLGGLAAVARPAIIVLWSEKWLPIVLPLQILCFRSALISVLSPLGSLFLCMKRPDIPFKFSLCTLAFTFGAVAGLGWAFGLNGVAVGMLVSLAPHLFLLWLAFHMMGVRLGRFFKGLVPAIIAAAVSSGLAFAAAHVLQLFYAPMAVSLVGAIAIGAIGYFGTMALFFRDTIRDVKQTVRIVLGRRNPLPARPASTTDGTEQ